MTPNPRLIGAAPRIPGGRPFLPALLLAGALLASPAATAGQIATDRPDFVESSATVGAGAVQVETSVAYGRTGEGALRVASWATPTLLRVGVAGDVELRLETEGWIRDASAAGVATGEGMADVAVGLKWHLTDEGSGRPSTALLLHADLPSGAETLRGDGVRPSLRGVAEWSLPDGFALGVMPGVALGRTGDDAYPAFIFGAVLGKEITASFKTFAEVAFEQIAEEEHGGAVGTVNGGFALLVSPNLQLDTAASWGVSGTAQDFAWTFGLSVLHP